MPPQFGNRYRKEPVGLSERRDETGVAGLHDPVARETESVGNGERFGFFKEFVGIGNETVDRGRSEIFEHGAVEVVEIVARNVHVAIR